MASMLPLLAMAAAQGGKVPAPMAQGGKPPSSLGIDYTMPQSDIQMSQLAQGPSQPAIQTPAPATAGPQSKAGRALKSGSASAAPQSSAQQPQNLYTAGNTMGTALGKGLGSIFTGGNAAGSMPAGQVNPGAQEQQAVQAATPDVDSAAKAMGYAPTGGQNFNSLQTSNTNSVGMPGMARGGKVPALVSPGEVYLPPKQLQEVKAKGNRPGEALKKGEKIPGKAKVPGNSYANDTIKKTLTEGGLVLPRSVTQAPNAPEAAARFVAAHMARGGIVRRKK